LIQVTPQMRVLVAIAPVDFRKGIDGLARIARDVLAKDPFSGSVFVFRNRRATAIKVLVYDGLLAVPEAALFRAVQVLAAREARRRAGPEPARARALGLALGW
jgi:hypothetical protein